MAGRMRPLRQPLLHFVEDAECPCGFAHPNEFPYRNRERPCRIQRILQVRDKSPSGGDPNSVRDRAARTRVASRIRSSASGWMTLAGEWSDRSSGYRFPMCSQWPLFRRPRCKSTRRSVAGKPWRNAAPQSKNRKSPRHFDQSARLSPENPSPFFMVEPTGGHLSHVHVGRCQAWMQRHKRMDRLVSTLPAYGIVTPSVRLAKGLVCGTVPDLAERGGRKISHGLGLPPSA
jgi:hypothetical protein